MKRGISAVIGLAFIIMGMTITMNAGGGGKVEFTFSPKILPVEGTGKVQVEAPDGYVYKADTEWETDNHRYYRGGRI